MLNFYLFTEHIKFNFHSQLNNSSNSLNSNGGLITEQITDYKFINNIHYKQEKLSAQCQFNQFGADCEKNGANTRFIKFVIKSVINNLYA